MIRDAVSEASGKEKGPGQRPGPSKKDASVADYGQPAMNWLVKAPISARSNTPNGAARSAIGSWAVKPAMKSLISPRSSTPKGSEISASLQPPPVEQGAEAPPQEVDDVAHPAAPDVQP